MRAATQTDLFADRVPAYLADVAPAVVAFWMDWSVSDAGREVITAAAEIALAELRAGRSRLFIDKLAWDIRAQTGHELNNTARSALSRYLMHVYPELRGCFDVRTKTRKAG